MHSFTSRPKLVVSFVVKRHLTTLNTIDMRVNIWNELLFFFSFTLPFLHNYLNSIRSHCVSDQLAKKMRTKGRLSVVRSIEFWKGYISRSNKARFTAWSGSGRFQRFCFFILSPLISSRLFSWQFRIFHDFLTPHFQALTQCSLWSPMHCNSP